LDQGLCGATDRDLIKICRDEQRALVTLDMDFGNPLIFRPGDYFGIAVLRLPPRPSHDDLLDTIRTLVGGLARETIEGRLWIVQRGRIRAYQPED
jgi:predicted nuclease of predicted toxin-antitoxin system